MSRFGRWAEEDGLPVFVYDADPAATPEAEWHPIVRPPTRRHWAVLGNRRIKVLVDNFGTVSLFDEHDGLRFVTAPDPAGTGVSLVDGAAGTVIRRRFGPTWFAVELLFEGAEVTRTVLVPEGESPWLLVRVDVRNPGTTTRHLELTERWVLRPRCISLGIDEEAGRANAAAAVRYEAEAAGRRVLAREQRTPAAEDLAGRRHPQWFGSPHAVVLEAVGPTGGRAAASGEPHPTLEVVSAATVAPGDLAGMWFRFGLDDGAIVDDPVAVAATWRAERAARLPRAQAEAAPAAAREVPWHAALLTGGACADGVLGGHTLDQASTYSYHWGFNGAARDPLQHALPLVYIEPDLALSVLRNTCSWGSPDGDLPYGLDGLKRRWTNVFQPSDQNLWALWLAAEYAAATGDVAAFAQPVGYHPDHGAGQVPLAEHLRRQFAFLVDGVGLGERGHLRIRNADWNDAAITTSGVPAADMIDKGESVLNSAMAAWVLPVYAGLCERLGDADTATAARRFADHLRAVVAEAWNGRWFQRAYGPGRGPIGEDDLWLEVQPWAILSGAATTDQAVQLLATIDRGPRAGSPLGARVRWPVVDEDGSGTGNATNGGIWYSINATLVWAAAAVDPALAWDEWRRMTLTAHEAAYPEVWEGTISGPDSYNSPESDRPGRTWALPDLGIGMQTFPVGNLHSHAQPLLAYLRLLGVEPAADGALRVAGPHSEAGARFASRCLTVEADGSGCLHAAGPVVVAASGGRVAGGPGVVRW